MQTHSIGVSETERPGRTRVFRPAPMYRQQFLAIALILPSAAVVAAAMLLPLGYALVMSLFDYRPGFEMKGKFLFLDNYVHFFQDSLALLALGQTLLFTFFALLLELAIGVGVSLLLLSIPAGIGKFLRGVFCMPLLISPIIVGLIWRYMYDPTFGLVYYLLGCVGLDRFFGGLQQPGWAMFCVILADVWETTPFVLLCATAGLVAIPRDLYEAARIDGAGWLNTFFRITLPSLRGVLAVVLVIRGTDAFRVFDIIYALTNGGPANSTLSLSIYAFKRGFEQYQMGYAMAVSIIMLFALICVFGPFLRPKEIQT
jgi:multiple sugar transport system permease protein